MSPLLPRKLSVQQGTTAAPVKTPAEDWRLNDGGLWTPGSSQLQERSGIVAGPGPSTGVEPLAVTAAAGGVFTIQPGRFFVQGSAVLQGGYLGTIDQVTTRTIAGADLPASGSFKAGYLGVKVYDQVYTDTQDGADVIYVLGSPAATGNTAVYPALPSSFLQLRNFTVDSTGTVTFGSYLAPFTVPRGGILPVRTEAAWTLTVGAYEGQTVHAIDTQANGVWDAAGNRWLWFDTKWQTYTPTLATSTPTNYMVVGNAQLAGRYFRTGRQIACEGQIVLGSTSSFSGGAYGALFIGFPTGYLPFQWSPNGYYPPLGSALINSGNGANLGYMLQTPGVPASGRRMQPYTAAGVAATGTANSPANWNMSAPGHQVMWGVVYETAFEA